MNIRIECDKLVVVVEGDVDTASSSQSLGTTALNLFIVGLEELRKDIEKFSLDSQS